MRKQAMLNAVKDSVIAAVFFAIAYCIFYYAEQNQADDVVGFVGMGAMALAMMFMVNFLAALGASALMGGSYSAYKSSLAIRVAIFNEDKNSSFFKMLKIVFFYFVGCAVYPLALLVSLLNLKDMFVENKEYKKATEQQQAIDSAVEERDETVKTTSKCWKLSNGPFENYYFHSKREALEYAIAKDITELPQKV